MVNWGDHLKAHKMVAVAQTARSKLDYPKKKRNMFKDYTAYS